LVGSGVVAPAWPAQANVEPASVVISWNRTMIDVLEATATPPPPAMRAGAIVAAAVFDAVNGVTGHYAPYHVTARAPAGSSAPAAAAGAAHEALVRLFPTMQASLDAALTQTLVQLSDGDGQSRAVTRGLAWGTAVADQIVNWRASDGINSVLPTYVSSPDPGRWQPTPPLFVGQPLFRQFATMTPFAMDSPGQFLPPAPPPLTGSRYATDLAEVEDIGSSGSPSRSAFDTQTAVFWNSDVPVAIWDRVADGLLENSDVTISRAARLLAQENISMADTVISVWNAKNYFDTWRPVTAIRSADTDGNPDTVADPTWTPLLITPPFQEYPSGHAGVSAAAAVVLAHEFSDATSYTVTAANLPGVQRSFTSFSDGASQVVDARVLGGIHFRFADEAAASEGRSVAAYVLGTQFLPVHGAGG
jgi:hypothetical protein